jgi:hypothetical protein
VPNYITHRVWAKGPESQVQKLIDGCFSEYRTDDGIRAKQPDFERIISSPEIVRQTESGSRANLGARLLRVLAGVSECSEEDGQAIGRQEAEEATVAIKRFFKEKPDVEKFGRLQLQCLEETGFSDWYGWNIEHWGTKWNALDGKIENLTAFKDFSELEFTLATAWSVPEPVWEKLAQVFPNVVFTMAFFDEGLVFAGEGCFNDPDGKDGFDYITPDFDCEHSRRLYEIVYGHEYHDWEDEK